MPLEEIRIDEQTWGSASDLRRLEWEANIRELLDPSELVARPDAHRLTITMTQQQLELALESADETPLACVAIHHDTLAEVSGEYVDIVRQLANTEGPGGLTRLEALDMAKKVTHDRAARLLKRQCRELGLDHATARRLFTLLLSLRVDTTRLTGVHGHRAVR